MPRKKTAKDTVEKLTRAKWQGFVNVYLSPEEKKQIKKEEFTEDWYYQFIQDVCTAGYKFSLSYSEEGNFWSASLTGQYAERPNAGVCMSLKHREMSIAITSLWWCLEQAGLMQEWSERYTQSDSVDW